MPLVIKDYVWEETPSTVAISVPLKGVKKSNVDVFSTDEFIKASFPPYIFEVLLYDAVDEDASIARIENGIILFTLVKKSESLWGQLCSPIMDDKPLYRRKIEENLVKAQQKAEDEVKRRNEKKRENDKYVLRKAMDLDQQERERIASIKEEEKRKATVELEKWKEQQRQSAQLEKEILEQEMRKENEAREIELRRQKLLEKAKRKNEVFEANSEDAVRASGKIEISFTPRVFPTAMRESTKHLEEEWLKKQAEARRTAEIEDADLSEEERNPMFMKEKGDKFFKGGDYQSAVNAYTHAIRLSMGKMPSLYSNRAACHLKLRNLIKCVEDSSKALELLNPPVQQNEQSRCKAHVRRGTAFCELELYVEGLQDYQAALKISPDNEQLQKDTERIRQIIQQSNG